MFTKEEGATLSIIRVLATFMIVACHILQGLGSLWAWILNVGVQIFFFLSGFLYGVKGVDDIIVFYYRRFEKIYIPYAIWITLAILLFIFFLPNELSTKSIIIHYLCLNGMGEGLPGLQHLWFIPVILFCYFLLPFFLICLKKKTLLTVVLFFIIIISLLYFYFHPYFIWVLVYYGGVICGKYPNIRKWVLIFSVSSIGVLGYNFDFSSLIDFSSARNLFIHALGGIILFLVLYITLVKWQYVINLNRHISLGSKLSYEIYLSHHLFILGPLSVLFATSSIMLNLCIIIGLTLFFSMLIQKINLMIVRFIAKYKCIV